ncbi:unnamed protein product, partial [Mesorhabditis spiculigera]
MVRQNRDELLQRLQKYRQKLANMRGLVIFIFALLGLVYGAPTATGGQEFDLDDILPDEMSSNFMLVAKGKSKPKTLKEALEALKPYSDTYEKVTTLLTAYKKRYAALTPGAKKMFEDTFGAGDWETLDWTTLNQETMAPKFGRAFKAATDEDRKSLQTQFPLAYKIITEPSLMVRLKPEFMAKVQRFRAQAGH